MAKRVMYFLVFDAHVWHSDSWYDLGILFDILLEIIAGDAIDAVSATKTEWEFELFLFAVIIGGNDW